ncbi:MAG: hypothetical protein H0V44_03160 [Planctomycetes bacterium]|nr:hypothetical protein [Planctomycetota bacterium]
MTIPDPAPARSGGGAPPRLDIGLWRGLKFLLLVNIIPIVGITWIAFTWDERGIHLRDTIDHTTARTAAVILVACGLIALSSWLVMPVARWIRDYPAWQFRNHSRILWFLPMIGGFATWLVLAAAGIAAAIISVLAILSGLLRLLGK